MGGSFRGRGRFRSRPKIGEPALGIELGYLTPPRTEAGFLHGSPWVLRVIAEALLRNGTQRRASLWPKRKRSLWRAK